MTDLTYVPGGMVVRFYAETEAGERAWNTMAEQLDGVATVYAWQLQDTLRQLRAAGYVVRRAEKARPMTDAELAAILDEVGG